jgi:hypothetical protein
VAILPTTRQVAQLLWKRTRARKDASVPGGILVGDFDDDTEPTGTQAAGIIETTANGFADILAPIAVDEAAWPDNLEAAAAAAIAYQAAATILASFPGDSADPELRDYYQSLATMARASLVTAIAEWRSTGTTGSQAATGDYVPTVCGVVGVPDAFTLGNRIVASGRCFDPRNSPL